MILNPQNIEHIVGCIINIYDDKENENNKNNYNYENIIYFLNKIKGKDLAKQVFLNKIGIYHLLKKDFYNKNNKYKLFKILLEDINFSFKNNYINKNTLYWQMTILKYTKINNILNNLDIPISNNLFKTFNEINFKEQITYILICIEEDDPKIKSQIIALNMKLNMEKWQNKIIEFNDIFLYEDIFFKEENREIKDDIINLINEIKSTNLIQINTKEYLDKLSKYDNIIKISKEN